MASLIRGIQVVLFEKRKIGTDSFRSAIYEETPVTVENVLVSPVSSEAITTDEHPAGKKAVCELHIPKADNHNWENSDVVINGVRWKTFGFMQVYIADNVPLDWNRKIKAERYG